MKKLEKKIYDTSVINLSVAGMKDYCLAVVEKVLKENGGKEYRINDYGWSYNLLYYRAVGDFIKDGRFFVEIDFCERMVSVTAFASV